MCKEQKSQLPFFTKDLKHTKIVPQQIRCSQVASKIFLIQVLQSFSSRQVKWLPDKSQQKKILIFCQNEGENI